MAVTEQLASRDRILREATRLFIEQGYHRLSMRELAESAGISKAGIYHHFKDKETLFLAVLCSHLEVLEAVIQSARAIEGDTRQRVEYLVRGIMAHSPSQRAIIRVARQEMDQLSAVGKETLRREYHQKFIAQITQLFAEGIKAGELIAVDPQLLTWALLGSINPYLYPSHTAGKTVSDETIETVLQIFFYGVIPR